MYVGRESVLYACPHPFPTQTAGVRTVIFSPDVGRKLLLLLLLLLLPPRDA